MCEKPGEGKRKSLVFIASNIEFWLIRIIFLSWFLRPSTNFLLVVVVIIPDGRLMIFNHLLLGAGLEMLFTCIIRMCRSNSWSVNGPITFIIGVHLISDSFHESANWWRWRRTKSSLCHYDGRFIFNAVAPCCCLPCPKRVFLFVE